MRILIVEDEAVAARGIERMVRDIVGNRIESLKIQSSLTASELFLEDSPIDLLLLDLNLNGEDGFELLTHAVADSFQTIVISANTDRAVEAFQYGVLDFVPKPVSPDRLRLAIDRYENATGRSAEPIKTISVRNDDTVQLVPIDEILYLTGSGNRVILHQKNGKELHHRKTLEAILKLLPPHFDRIHKSCIADLREFDHFKIRSGGKYSVVLKNGESLPLSRTRYRELKESHDLPS